MNRSLSMQSADAVTPEPTYGTPASSSSPCTVPSSPKGPCRIGSTTSTAPSAAGRRCRRHGQVRARLAERAAERRRAGAPTHRRARSRSSGSRSGPGRAPRRPSAPRRARSRARSSGHPRARPRAAAASRGGGGVVVVSVVVSSWSWSCRPAATYFPTNSVTTRVRILLAVADRILGDHDAVERLDVGVLRRHRHLESRGLQGRRRVRLRLARDVRQRRRLRPVRHGEVDRRPLRRRRRAARHLADDDPCRLVLSTSVRATAKPAAWSC